MRFNFCRRLPRWVLTVETRNPQCNHRSRRSSSIDKQLVPPVSVRCSRLSTSNVKALANCCRDGVHGSSQRNRPAPQKRATRKRYQHACIQQRTTHTSATQASGLSLNIIETESNDRVLRPCESSRNNGIADHKRAPVPGPSEDVMRYSGIARILPFPRAWEPLR